MNPRNSNAFFDPKICICASTQFTMFTWLGINPVCGRPVLGATESCYSPPPDGVAHGYNGIYNRGYVCAANVIAPKNKKELYRWLARIQNSMYPALSTPNLISVINGDLGPPDDPHNNAINNGFCTFRDINFDKIELPNLKNGGDFKKYISTYPGQRMICALDITNVWLFMPRPSAERYSSPEKCMEKLKDLVKCVLVPMGPPPLPLTPFIVHDIQANVVYDSNPLSTASTIKPNLKVRIIDTKGRLIELKPNQEIKEGDNLFNLQDHTGQTTDNYEIKINVTSDKICTSLLKASSAQYNPERELGCFPRLDKAIPIISTNNNPFNIALMLKYKGQDLVAAPGLKPIDLLTLKTTDVKAGIDYYTYEDTTDPENSIYFSAMREGFSRNPDNIKTNFLAKRVCVFFSSTDGKSYFDVINLNQKCEDSTNITTSASLFQCNDSGQIVQNANECTSALQIVGKICPDGELIKDGDSCKAVSSMIEFDDDLRGNKICARDFPYGNDQFLTMRKNPLTLKYEFVSFSETGKLLIPLVNGQPDTSTDGAGNYKYKQFGNFTQNYLDNLAPYMNNYFSYTNGSTIQKYWYTNAIMDTGTSQTTYISNGSPFFSMQDDIELKANPSAKGLCVDLNISLALKTWEYILQLPMYYANYDITTDADMAASPPLKVPGVFLGSSANPALTFNDSEKAKIIFVPTEYELLSSGATPSSTSTIGINSNVAEVRDFDNTILANNQNFSFKSFNLWSKFIESIKANSKIPFTDGTNLINPNPDEKLFDTSGCDLIDFEIWGGGSDSNAHFTTNSTNISVTQTAVNGNLDYCINPSTGAHTGQNGSYAKGRFRIQPGSKLRIKVANSNGDIYASPTSIGPSIVQDGDFSAIWVQDDVDKEPTLMVKAYSGSSKHYCSTSANCTPLNLKNDEVYDELLTSNNIFKVQDGSTYNPNGFSLALTRALTVKDDELNNSILAIDKYRFRNFSSGCGKTISKDATIPVSFPVILQKFNDQGSTTSKTSPDFTDAGTGNQNDIGLYFYEFFKDPSRLIDWKTRGENNYNNKFEEVCRAHLELCWVNSTTLPDGTNTVIKTANSRVATSSMAIDDLNLYCPGIGGCYYANEKKAVVQSGTPGLVKISCKKYVP